MGAFAAGQAALLPFSFSDLTRSKLWPALLLADAGRDDWIACQITCNSYADPHAILLAPEDFTSGGLQRSSYARPGKLFTANTSLPIQTKRSVTDTLNLADMACYTAKKEGRNRVHTPPVEP